LSERLDAVERELALARQRFSSQQRGPVVGASSFAVVRDGAAFGELSSAPEGCSLTLSHNGASGVVFAVAADGSPRLRLIDGSGQRRLNATVTEQESNCPKVALYDSNQVLRLDLSVDPVGAPTLCEFADDGSARLAVLVSKNGDARIGSIPRKANR
jgi:hypothetical protein